MELERQSIPRRELIRLGVWIEPCLTQQRVEQSRTTHEILSVF